MADMAPALTGAAHEAPHRLTLSSASSNAWKARGGLLLLNGGGRAEDAPGPGELMEGAPGPGRREEEEDGPAKRLDIAPGPGRRLQGAPGTGYTPEGGPGPRRRTLGEGRRKPPGPAICPLPEGPAAAPPKSAHGPAVTPGNQAKSHQATGPTGNLAKGHLATEPMGNQVKGHPGPMGNQAKGHPAPGPMGNQAKGHPAPGPMGNLAKGHPEPTGNLAEGHLASGPTGSNAKGHLATEPTGNNAKGHLAGRDLAPEPTGRTEGVTDRVPGPLTCIPGSRGPQDIAPGPLTCIPGSRGPEDIAPWPLTSIPGTRGPQEVARGAMTSKPAASQGCTPGTRGHKDFAPGSVTSTPGSRGSQGFAPGPPRDSQDAAPGPGVLCARRAAQMSSRQQELGARARRLCRRLQVIQAKQVERHVRQQLSGLVELLSERGAAGLPGAPHVELDRLACSSTARLRAAQGGFDSDATESSSGGESDEEEEDEEDEAAGESPGHERAEEEPSRPTGSERHSEWRWAVERAAIICRWTWLQAQVSDLEFRIRQQTEIYKQIRCTKGSVALGDPPHCEDSAARLNARGNRVPSSCNKTAPKTPSGDDPCDSLCNTPSPSPQSLDKQCSRLMQSVENVACQNPPTTPVCDSSGSQKSSRQVNGLINCVRSSASCNGSTEDLDPEEVLGKKRRVDPPSSSPALSDSSCVAARSRPLRSHKKRSLVRASDVASLSRKPQKPLSTKCGCDPPTTCILCGCKTYAKTSHPSTLALNERIALMDPCYHPILSFPYDTPLHLHFEALLKEDRQFRVSNKLKILKLSQLAKKPHEAGRSMLRDDRQYKGVPSPSIHVSSAVTPRPNTAAHQLPSINDTPPSASQNSSSAALKRKRFENSYDIDNIVIPMSLVAASRVEKLQYKEILTPSWRVLDSAEIETLDVDPQLEDLSDDAYQDRHSKYEDLERSRWDSWTSATPQRRGSRSSNKSDGRWTPQPPNSQGSSQQTASPDIRFQSLNDLPLSLSSAASDSPEPYSTVQCLSVHSRTRVLSWSEDTRSSTPEIPDDEEQIIQPWEPRSFPLTDRDCRTLQNMPGTPSRGRTKPPPDVSWQTPSKPSGAWTENIDSGMSTENLTPASKEPPLPNSISVVRVRAHSGDKIASLEYFPARPVNKR